MAAEPRLTEMWPDVLDVAKAARLLGMTERALRGRVARRLVPYRRYGSRIIFLKHELERLIADLPGVSIAEARNNLQGRRMR